MEKIENLGLYNFVSELKNLNINSKFKIDARERIQIDTKPELLKLPEGYVFTDNCFTNKGNTISGEYEDFYFDIRINLNINDFFYNLRTLNDKCNIYVDEKENIHTDINPKFLKLPEDYVFLDNCFTNTKDTFPCVFDRNFSSFFKNIIMYLKKK